MKAINKNNRKKIGFVIGGLSAIGATIWLLNKRKKSNCGITTIQNSMHRVREAKTCIVNYYRQQKLCDEGILLTSSSIGNVRINPAACEQLLQAELLQSAGAKHVKVTMIPLIPQIKFICSLTFDKQPDRAKVLKMSQSLVSKFAYENLAINFKDLLINISIIIDDNACSDKIVEEIYES